jgi:hypothetical protein
VLVPGRLELGDRHVIYSRLPGVGIGKRVEAMMEGNGYEEK